ncbi:hypothetical protein SAMN05421595_2560 [Austwickia chelonae]|uniref:Uncharacterized protein n=1 Tax=Austwickia chelonae NBRC 105200 TaxID=1184607 RepID=K6WBP4_9MICO|nr:hypothetical protein [Austwickia chelonae]GAB79252.1 hypothetical protein AUCHE_22_00220 [Austwickia chelonae NBRC 105200]SEW37609.1 hypothetical protein SAMN05421595_2560 [Austwickia chelonae]
MKTSSVLADDAIARTSYDPDLPIETALAPALRLLQTQGCPGDDTSLRTLTRAVSDTGLLDIGLDALLADARGGTPAQADATRGAKALFDAAVADIAALCPTAARYLRDQRDVMEMLATGRPTIANERLLHALRRGTVTVVLPAGGQAPLPGELLPDGGVRIAQVDLPVHGSPLGAALILTVRLPDGTRTVGWTGLVSGQVIPVTDCGGDEWCGRISLRECTIGPDEVIGAYEDASGAVE